jgi:hypothetical protein
VDPFGHLWFVGDRSPLRGHPAGGRAVNDAKPGPGAGSV